MRVVSLARTLAGAYCAKLLADVGHDVLAKPLDPAALSPSTALCDWLQHPTRLIDGPPPTDADVLICDELDAIDPASCSTRVVVTITPFGWVGQWRDRPANEFLLQAWCGSIGPRGMPDEEPVAAGGLIGEWVTGVAAAAGAVAAARQTRADGRRRHVDISMLEVMATTMTAFHPTMSSFDGWPRMDGPVRNPQIPGIEPTADGYVGFTTVTATQASDFFAMIERPDLAADATLASGVERARRATEMLEAIHAWTLRHRADEIVELANALRVPTAPIGRADTVLNFDHLRERGVFVEGPSGVVGPRPPFRITGGRDRIASAESPRSSAPSSPLDGLRVVDFTTVWAGPMCTQYLASLGADVIKVESFTHLDAYRATRVDPKDELWYEHAPLFHALNRGKRGIAIDLADDRKQGREIARRLVASADVVIENSTPRVMDGFGFDWASVHEINPRVIYVRMPAYGLDGPWRDRPGYATTMEQLAGLAWVTGFPDGPPQMPFGVCDPNGGLHAAFAILAALDARDGDGLGRLIEVPLLEGALTLATEQIVEFSATGRVMHRIGNRSRTARLQGLFPCAGDDEWIAVSLDTAEQVEQFASIEPARTLRQLAKERAVELLLARGLPAAPVIRARDVAALAPIAERGLYRTIDDPRVGRHPMPRPAVVIDHTDFLRAARPAPTLGQHNHEVLHELGFDPSEIAAFEAHAVISQRLDGRSRASR